MSIVPKAPLFRDPIYDGAADPVVIWNKHEKNWWLFYTNRRAWGPCVGESYMHGSDIGVATSDDFGKNWVYRGVLQGLEIEPGRNTYWAPEIIEYQDTYHMYLSYVQGVPNDWEHERHILHYTSKNLWDWQYESTLELSSNRVIDSCVIQLPNGCWKMWYKDEVHQSHTYTAFSEDLYHWKVGDPDITDCMHEGPNVFYFEGLYWMITDPWDGLGVYKSNDAFCWERCSNILQGGGIRKDDGVSAAHADVLVHNGHAYIFYFTHPDRKTKDCPEGLSVIEMYERNRSSIQVAELMVKDGELICERNQVTIDLSIR